MIDKHTFVEHIHFAYQQISSLPATESKYYLYLLVNSIKNKNNIKTQRFLTELLKILDDLKKLHNLGVLYYLNNYETFNLLFKQIRGDFVELGKIAETHNFNAQAQFYLLNAAGTVFATLFGVAGGVIGGIAGFARGLWHFKPLTGFLVGLGTGILMGGLLGFRTPKKLFKNEMQRQIKFGLDGLEQCLDLLQKEVPSSSFFSNTVKPFSVYLKEVEEEIKGLFNDQNEFNQFLDRKVDYVINTLVATFIGDPMLSGYVGHHSYIKINIKDAQYLIEFAPEPSDLSGEPSQSEKRVATGRKLIEMLAYHRKLQETHACDTHYIVTKAKPGDTDCLSYINKVLIGTNQKATTVKRFINMALVGRIFGDCVEKLSPFKPDFFQEKKTEDFVSEQSLGIDLR